MPLSLTEDFLLLSLKSQLLIEDTKLKAIEKLSFRNGGGREYSIAEKIILAGIMEIDNQIDDLERKKLHY